MSVIDGSAQRLIAVDFYIDDKGVRFEGDWGEVADFVEKRTSPH